jgi:hypothetical protein
MPLLDHVSRRCPKIHSIPGNVLGRIMDTRAFACGRMMCTSGPGSLEPHWQRREIHTPRGTHLHPLESCGDDVRFAVANTGRGISPEQLPHIFRSFWQANSMTAAPLLLRGAGVFGHKSDTESRVLSALANSVRVAHLIGHGYIAPRAYCPKCRDYRHQSDNGADPP